MNRSSRRLRLCGVFVLSILIVILGANSFGNAQAATDAQIKALQDQIDQLQRTVNQLKVAQTQSAADAEAARKQAIQTQAPATQEKAKAEHKFLERKKGNAATFYTTGGEITAYGKLDVSFDGTTKDAGSLELNGSSAPTGNFGWMPAISTNISYLGVRGFQRIPDHHFDFVYQLEVGFDISATPGLKLSNSNLSDTVNGALFNRNTYIGLSSPRWGAVKIGKTDAPYKNSTAEFNPFVGMLGDYAVVMGNTGGDNRVEFGTRLDHAIWYESPKFGGGFQFNALFAPGQNRSSTSDNVAAGESDCAGGNAPESGGNLPVACNDGAFSNAVSTSLSYTKGRLYVVGAYEFHQNANRQSDITSIYGFVPDSTTSATSLSLFNHDIGNEDAAKIGILYRFPKTTVGAIGESMHRYLSSDLKFQNERQRYGTWLVVTQKLSEADRLHFGWAHAFRTPGDPGQHNDSTLTTADGATFAPTHNQSDMLTLAYMHTFARNLTWYVDAAATLNGPSAHFDLGAGGRGVTTDCHDAFSTSSGYVATPRCYTGTTLVGVSSGLRWTF
jgi:predicted porin